MTDKPKYEDYPFAECALTCAELIRTIPGVEIYQKFTCANCGARQTIDEPNCLYTSGKCEECGHVTNIQEKGCNYMVVYRC